MLEPTPQEIQEAREKFAKDQTAAIERRKASLPATVDAPKRENTVILLPLHDGRPYYACVRGLMEVIPYVSGIIDQQFSSLISLTRNKLVNGFLTLPPTIQWAVMIDSDIGFTSQDFGYLVGSILQKETDKENYLSANAPYARKDDSEKVIERGLGFSIVHRSVLELIRAEIARPFQFEGVAMHDFFIVGATAAGGYLGEDAGFWWMCSQVGVKPRLERRTNLVHWGAKDYRMPAIESADFMGSVDTDERF